MIVSALSSPSNHSVLAKLTHLVLVALIALGLTSRASAQTTPEPNDPAPTNAEVAPLVTVLTGEALTAYESGRLLFEDGDFRGALAQFKRAYVLTKEPRLLWNMATCEKEQRHYGQAVHLITEFLEVGGTAIPTERREEANATLEALKAFVSDVQLHGVPNGARVTIDGMLQQFEGEAQTLSLDLGSHMVRVEAAGYHPFEQQLEVLGKTPLAVTVVLQPLPRVGHLRIEVVGGVGAIRLDDKLVGQGRFDGEVPAGEHAISVETSGKRAHQERVTLAPLQSRTLHITLQDEPTPLWPWIVGGALILAGGGVGGYFLFADSSDGNAGPRPSLGSFDL